MDRASTVNSHVSSKALPNDHSSGFEPYVSLTEVAEFLGMSKATLEKWRFRNELPFPVYQIGRRLRFKLSEVDEWAQSQAADGIA